MSGFYYYVEGLQADKSTKLSDLPGHLPEIFSDCEAIEKDVLSQGVAKIREGEAKGPSQPGSVLYPLPISGEMPDVMGYRPDQQHWRPTGHPNIFVGWDKLRPPTPDDMRRKTVYPGYIVTDDLDQQWQVPVARSSDSSKVTLPANFTMDLATGKVLKKIKPEFEDLWAIAGEIWDWMNSDVTPHRDQLWLAAQALQVLQVHYRIDWPEVNALEDAGKAFLDNRMIVLVATAVIDWEIIKTVQAVEEKKSDPAAEISS